MTSKECFVYITLPNKTDSITAGKFILEQDLSGENIGKFVYAKSYLARPDAVAIDPIELKLHSKVYETLSLKGVFGAIRDASPDYWGRRLIERRIGQTNLHEIDYLLESPDDRIGALSFGLSVEAKASKTQFNQILNLEELLNLADKIVKDNELSKTEEAKKIQLEELLLLSTSVGGARPKVVVETDNALWIAKFNRFDDRFNNARIEQAMLQLAKKCGISVPESRLIKVASKDVLLIKRFDREKTETGYLRFRMISAMTVLKSDDDYTRRDKWSYVLLAEELRRISKNPKEDAIELFKRMTFNALISNTDDHPRNHAFIARCSDWRLSPAYDLTPSTPISTQKRDLALIIGDFGRTANKDNLLSQASRFLLSKYEAEKIVNNIHDIVSNSWYKAAKEAGVNERDCKKISSAFAYEGFFLKQT